MAETRALRTSRPPETIPRGKLQALAPKDPSAALLGYSAAQDAYYARVLKLVDKHLLQRLPVLGSGDPLDRTGLQLGLAALQIDLLALAEKTRVPARVAGRRAAESAAKEVGRMMRVSLPKRDARVAALADAFAAENVALMRRIAAAQTARIQKAIDEYVEGESMRATILDATWVARNRANLIGRDQVHKMQDQQVSFWCVELGSEGYIYVDSRDERVRESHREHHGKFFRWDTPPSTGHPGTQIQCRCKAVPVEAFSA